MSEEDVIDAEIVEGSTAGQDSHLVIAREIYPSQLPILPIQHRPTFPKMITPLILDEKDQIEMIKSLMNSNKKMVGLVLQFVAADDDGLDKDESENFQIHEVGVIAHILKIHANEDENQVQVVLGILDRMRIKSIISHEPIIMAEVEYLYDDEKYDNDEMKAYAISIIKDMKELVKLNPLHKEELTLLMANANVAEPGNLADFAAALTSQGSEELQEVLEAIDIRKRVELVLFLLKKELDLSKLQAKINKQIEDKISKQQRDFFLREQLKVIKKELGLSKESKEQEIEKFNQRIKKLKLNDETRQKIEEELESFKLLETSSPEYNLNRTYLDWLTVLPWGIKSEDNKDLQKAEKILNRDHFGLEDVKERILEFLSVSIKKGNVSGSIICFVGPPGVGKTSIGRSIAESLNRKYYRFSLGGMRDEAEIKGHRRTYIGAMPGKFIQAIRHCGTSNPLIMLDEIDKVGSSYQGDPASALLEVLDPEQNIDFLDHYLDCPFDLSDVLFVCTANQLDTIPRALIDRMEVIFLSGYILEEKLMIVKKFIWPKQLKEHGLNGKDLKITTAALRLIIEDYAREPGVRNLEKNIKKIIRKSVRKLLRKRKKALLIDKKDIEPLLGLPIFRDDDLSPNCPGVVNGLAWTSLGGCVMTIEATSIKGKREFKLTGQLGQVMIESAQISYTYVQTILADDELDGKYYEEHKVHLHVPAGATPKDGPSAGITMATALYSLAKKIKVKKGVAMTGELSLTGKVMPIGGLKEKLLAAKRMGIKEVIIPASNEKDYKECPPTVTKGLKIHMVDHFSEVVLLCFRKKK